MLLVSGVCLHFLTQLMFVAISLIGALVLEVYLFTHALVSPELTSGLLCLAIAYRPHGMALPLSVETLLLSHRTDTLSGLVWTQ